MFKGTLHVILLNGVDVCNDNDLDTAEYEGHNGFLISNTFYLIIL